MSSHHEKENTFWQTATALKLNAHTQKLICQGCGPACLKNDLKMKKACPRTTEP